MRVVFMGTPDFSVPVLEALVEAGHEVAAVYCQPPRPAGRGKKDRPTPVHARAEALGLEVRHPERLKGAEEQAEFAALGRELLEAELPLPRPIRLMGLTLSSLEGVEKGSRREKAARAAQLSLL